MILVVGEILYDVFPSYKRLGGAPFNFAFHLKHLGFPVRFVSRIGNDPDGKEILNKLDRFGFDLNDIQIDPDRPTGHVRVRLDDNGTPDFNIIPHVAYDYIEFDKDVHRPLLQQAELFYYGSLIQRSRAGFDTIQTILSQKPRSTKCFYDVNLRPACYNDTVVTTSMSRANILKINKEEQNEVKRIVKYENDNNEFIKYLMDNYPLEVISLTKGGQGSEIHTRDGYYRVASEKIDDMVDSVGAGDAYAAILAAGTMRKWHPETIIRRASAFASHVCTIAGALPESSAFYKPFADLLEE